MQNRAIRVGPVALANAAANIFNPPTTAGGGSGDGMIEIWEFT